MKAHLLNLSYVARHKFFVAIACFREGLYWRGLIHDWHKFLPSEWFPYTEFFFANPSPRDGKGYYKPTDTGHTAFDFAWLLHQKRSDHHWQWWMLPKDVGGVKILPMSHAARTEMLCDWWGAGRAQLRENHEGWNSVRTWYDANHHKMQLHPDTRAAVEAFIATRQWRSLDDQAQ